MKRKTRSMMPIVLLFLAIFFIPLVDGDILASIEETSTVSIVGHPSINTGITAPVIPFSGFMKNLGQLSDDSVLFYYTQGDRGVNFGMSTLTFVDFSTASLAPAVVTVDFSDFQPVSLEGQERMDHAVNYFHGNVELTDIPAYREIWYRDLYPGIDLRFYMTAHGLEHEFVMHKGTDTVQIAEKLNEMTNLLAGERMFLPSQSRDQFSKVKAGSGNTEKSPLMVFNTFLGGNESDYGYRVTLDAAGNSYIVGSTQSSDFPTKNAYNSTYGGDQDVFVAKLNATGNGLVFSTFLGGSDPDYGYGIVLDADGNIYVTGHTYSDDFPTKNAYNSTLGLNSDVFITKLNATGNGLEYSTFLGGSNYEYAHSGIKVDASGNAYIAGYTRSKDFPMENAYNSTPGNPGDPDDYDVFVAKLNATGNGLVFSTFLGGGSDDRAGGIALDAAGNSYVTGYTQSSDFPVENAYNSTHGSNGLHDAFVTKLNATGNGLVFSTFLGGGNADQGIEIALDAAGNSYVTGYTQSSDFPVENAYNSSFGGAQDVFVAKLNATGNGLVFSTFLGGTLD
ncbi:MAG: SBBP repeat-containing protein, partial [Candidatus Odinarchaeota archaeon]